jgi:hypothetical protein
MEKILLTERSTCLMKAFHAFLSLISFAKNLVIQPTLLDISNIDI